MAGLKSFCKLFMVIEITMSSLLRLAVAVSSSGWSPGLVASRARQWAATLVKKLDIHIEQIGNIPEGAALVVSNHRSYLDIIVILSRMNAAFLAKKELESWPIFGLAAKRGNTVFVDRSSAESRATARQALGERLAQGISVVVFPEGTTSAGPGILPFKKGIFHLAAEKKIPVVPVAVCYEDPKAAWTGNDFFLPHFLEIFKTAPLKARLSFGPVLRITDGTTLTAAAQAGVQQQLKSIQ
jgi:1-acyl-sn-glycerol-3-phosphate acyltransferase